MRYSISVLIGVACLIGRSATAYNFDDHNRALHRAKDLNDDSPLTDEEVNRLKSMVDRGHFKVLKEEDESAVAEGDGNLSMLQRALKRKRPVMKKRTAKRPPAKARQRTVNRKPPPPPTQQAGRTKPKGSKPPPPQGASRSHHDYYDDYYPMDDYYYGKGGKGSQDYDDYYYMDDHYYMDDYYIG